MIDILDLHPDWKHCIEGFQVVNVQGPPSPEMQPSIFMTSGNHEYAGVNVNVMMENTR